MTIVTVMNTRINQSVEYDMSESNDFYNLLNEYPEWKTSDKLIVYKFNYKFICKNQEDYDTINHLENEHCRLCSCNALLHYGYVVGYLDTNTISLDHNDLYHCNSCHNIWDGNAQCNCYEM